MKCIKICASMVAVLAMSIACGATSKPLPRSSGDFSPAHLVTVLRGAIVISNPGTPLLVSDSRLQRIPGGYEFRVSGEEWSGYYQASTPVMDIDHPLTVTLDHSGNVRDISKLPFSRLDGALRNFGRGAGDESDWILPRLSAGIRVRAVAEFEIPMSERELAWNYQSNRYFLSRGSGSGRPIYWGGDIECPAPSVRRDCDSHSAIDTFRAWVGQLTEKDRLILDKFGISLDALRVTAKEGRIYGLIQQASPQVIRQFKKNRNVRSLWIVDMWPCRKKEACP
ncbi:hypothetical protein IL992_10350 [Microbispora sp. NEAU-D428]|uniref:hypothetical protein n=1 Tax=Microbispora sitophila TaxID=2771537 RepID=UPI00186766D8|nr:hypothetical protein [Microbispora sitophila]MBE3009596.1 hypothetical protein [Microbispora sitophila]